MQLSDLSQVAARCLSRAAVVPAKRPRVAQLQPDQSFLSEDKFSYHITGDSFKTQNADCTKVNLSHAQALFSQFIDSDLVQQSFQRLPHPLLLT